MSASVFATIDDLKAGGHYFAAGAVAASLGASKYYGCHFGMKSDLDRARSEFFAGYEAALALTPIGKAF